MGARKKVTIGYKYYMALHMGFCRGPVDELVQINVGDKEVFGPGAAAWTHNTPGKMNHGPAVLSPLTDGQQIYIYKPDLFGGEKKEGGIEGWFQLLTGEPTQTAPTALKQMLGGLVPAFRGTCTAVYDGMVCAMNPYPKRWAVRMRRIVKGWDGIVWYPEKALISLAGGKIKAMNPAHILLEAQTNRDWGRGKHRSLLDLASFAACADQLHSEGFGLCLKWKRGDDVSRFEALVLDHIGAVHYLSRTSGLWTLKLIREDYQKASLPQFKQGGGLLAIDEQRSGSADAAANQFIVNYIDPISGKTRQVRSKNLGAIQQAGGAISTTKEYPGLPTASLAARVAARECFAATGNVRRVKIRLDRRGHALNPGDVFRLHAPERGIEDTVFRVGIADYGTLGQSEITLTAVEDLFTLPESSPHGEQTPVAPPDTKPRAIDTQRLFEACWYDLCSALAAPSLAQIKPEQASLGVLAARPAQGVPVNYLLMSKNGSAEFSEAASGDFCPTALAIEPLPQSAAPITLTLQDAQDFQDVELNSAVRIEGEILKLVAFDLGAGTVTLHRGCADSVPEAHPEGSRLWFYEDGATYDPADYFSGETPQIKLLTRSHSETLAENLAPTLSLSLDARQNKPYPPGNLRINGASYPSQISGALTLSWAHRNRLLQADQLHGAQLGSITSEAGVTYSLRIYGETNALRLSQNGLTDTAFSWSEADELAASNLTDASGDPRLNASLRIELWSVRDGLQSAQKHNLSITRNLP